MIHLYQCLWSRVVDVLRGHFNSLLSTGNVSVIADELRLITFQTVCVFSIYPFTPHLVLSIKAAKFGSNKEWEKLAILATTSASASDRMFAIHGLCSFEDESLVERTFLFVRDKCRDQDLIHFFNGLRDNSKYRRTLTARFRENYETVSDQLTYNPRFNQSKAFVVHETRRRHLLSATRHLGKVAVFFSTGCDADACP